MKLNVPFFQQTSPLNCGPSALKMIFAYFGEDFPILTLEEKSGLKEGKAITSVQLATCSALLGFTASLYSISLSFNQEHLKLDYYQKNFDMDLVRQAEQLVNDAAKAGVHLEERSLSYEEILSFITQESVPLILLDWSFILESEKGYLGHFVPLTGYDENGVYVHDHGLKNPTPNKFIPKELFEKARKAKGTDEDLIVIRKKL